MLKFLIDLVRMVFVYTGAVLLEGIMIEQAVCTVYGGQRYGSDNIPLSLLKAGIRYAERSLASITGFKELGLDEWLASLYIGVTMGEQSNGLHSQDPR